MRGHIAEGVLGIIVVVRNNCGDVFSYRIDGPQAIFLGDGDQHETEFDQMEVVVELSMLSNTHPSKTSVPGHCMYSMVCLLKRIRPENLTLLVAQSLYPSTDFKAMYDSDTPEVFAYRFALAFAFIAVTFFIYDILVQRRNFKLVTNAANSNAIVSSMIPRTFRDRYSSQLTDYMRNPTAKLSSDSGCAPLADLFLEATVVFADVV